ncbi:MAG TPA: cyclase family protein [Actinophytocola sp.]|uniref:cyclase family protein n=1 Tax=Actinophytocola sp. TaxID=1872138 RepID=UPI002E05A498|nr:cyclase family protein [Actinophytocola sp.]
MRAACDHHAERRPVNRRAVLAAGGVAGLIGLLPTPAAHAAEKANRLGRLQDLTHTFSPRFPVGAPPAPSRSTIFTIPRDGFYAQQWSFWEHTATHLDAPGHFIPGGRPVTAIDPAELMFLPAEIIDISRRADQNPDATVEVSDLRRHEARHGRIPNRAMVLMNSGWQRRVTIPGAFTNPDPSGTYHFPGFTADAAEFLLDKRNITGIGVDTLSLDAGAVPDSPSTTASSVTTDPGRVPRSRSRVPRSRSCVTRSRRRDLQALRIGGCSRGVIGCASRPAVSPPGRGSGPVHG